MTDFWMDAIGSRFSNEASALDWVKRNPDRAPITHYRQVTLGETDYKETSRRNFEAAEKWQALAIELQSQLELLEETLKHYRSEESWYKLPLTEERNEAYSVNYMRIFAEVALNSLAAKREEKQK